MKFISNFQQFDIIKEATLDDSKINTSYVFSRKGRDVIEKLFKISQDIKLINTSKSPRNSDTVLWIRRSTIQSINFSDLKIALGVDSKDNLMMYQTTSKKYPWAVAMRGQLTTMVKQADRVGASKRGEHFRETAFIVTFAVQVWKEKRVPLKIFSNRGEIKMTYQRDGEAYISHDERAEFRKEYAIYMLTNEPAINAMKDQCKKLIERFGDDVKDISYITKNTSDLIINKVATNYIKDEMQIAKDVTKEESIEVLDLPSRVSLAKWNPSDIWIVFNGFDWTMESPLRYEDEGIDDLSDLNNLLMMSILSNSGLIGVSLKQSSNKGIIAEVNTETGGVNHRYNGFVANNNNKTVVIKFKYRFLKGEEKEGDSFIDCRTFDTTNRSSISLEVKGSKKAKHMSGKAGSILEKIMPERFIKIKEIIRLNTSKKKIADLLSGMGWEPMMSILPHKLTNDQALVYAIFQEDLSSPGIKTAEQNSRMQSMVLLDWLLGMDPKYRNKTITNIVKFAKSESIWSAPHIVAK